MSATKREKSSVRHTRAIQYSRTKIKPDAPPPEDVHRWMVDLVHPATFSMLNGYQQMGLRSRILDLPVMVAMLVSMIWRQVGSVSELVRMLAEEGLLWVDPVDVSQQAVSARIRTFPAQLLKGVLLDLLPRMQSRFEQRTRPLPKAVRRAKRHYGRILIGDGSTLDVLLRKVGLLEGAPAGILAGKLAVLLDLTTRLPVAAWLNDDPKVHDLSFRSEMLEALAAGDLVILDRGFVSHRFFDELTDAGICFLTRAKSNQAIQELEVLHKSAEIHDRIITLGGRDTACAHRMRLVEIRYRGKWYRYLTNDLDPHSMPPLDAADLYRRRWRIEDAFSITKRLLGLSYMWVGSTNGVALQVWATWLVYAMLVDLTDAVADRTRRHFDELSMEMVFRGLYHYSSAVSRGDDRDVVTYLADKANRLGLIKRVRKKKPLTPPSTA